MSPIITAVPFSELSHTLPAPAPLPPPSIVRVVSQAVWYTSAHRLATGKTVDEPATLIAPSGPHTTEERSTPPSAPALDSIRSLSLSGITTYPVLATNADPLSERPKAKNGLVF